MPDERMRVIEHSGLIAMHARKPWAPNPGQNMRDDRNDEEHNEAEHEDAVELPGLLIGQTG